MRSWTPLIVALALSAGPALPAAAAPAAWTEAGAGAVALLPPPDDARGIASATLFCSEQRWAFYFRTDGAVPDGTVDGVALDGVVTVGGEPFPVAARAAGGGVEVPVPFDILQPLQDAGRMGVRLGDGPLALAAVFSLRGSRAVIDAILPRCSAVDLSGYEPVGLRADDPVVPEAEALLAEEMRRFRGFVGRKPEVAAALVALEEGQALLFASLCGSTAYFGLSGCMLAGFARREPGADWQPAYATEGMRLHLDRSARRDGFPELVTVPQVGPALPLHWRWDGEGYAVYGDDIVEAGEAGAAPEPSRP